MAYKTSKNEEHAYQKIQKELKADALSNPLFFYGREGYLIEWALNAIVKKYVNPATASLEFTSFDGSQVTLDEIESSCETLPMFSAKRIVMVRDFSVLAGNKSKNFPENDEKDLADYIKDIPATTMLIFTATTCDKRKRLFKSIQEVGETYDFKELDQRLLSATIEKRLKQAGKTAKSSAITQFIHHTGYYNRETDYTMFNLENDLKKAIAYAQGEEVKEQDFLTVVAGNIDTDLFAMLDALSKDNKAEAFERLRHILDSGESVYKLLAIICSQFEIMLSAKEMKEEGMSFIGIQKRMGVHEFRLKKALQFADGYTVAHLREILSRAYEVDKNIKNGTLEQNLAIEMFVAEI